MSRRKKKAKPDNRCCENCVNCLPVGDGDHICNMDPSKVVLEEYSFFARLLFTAILYSTFPNFKLFCFM